MDIYKQDYYETRLKLKEGKIQMLEEEKEELRIAYEQCRRILSLLLQTIWANPSYVNTTDIYHQAVNYLKHPITKDLHANDDFGMKL